MDYQHAWNLLKTSIESYKREEERMIAELEAQDHADLTAISHARLLWYRRILRRMDELEAGEE